MSERDALMRHIIEQPDDDGARLVMADWFDEYGEPERAEFIRLQVSLAQEDVADDEPFRELTRTRTTRSFADPDRRRRFDRMNELHDRHRAAWVADLAKWARPAADFCRGFVDRVGCAAGQWLRGANGLHRVAPVTDLRLSADGKHLSQLAAHPRLIHARSLALWPVILSADDAAVLAASPYIASLRRLHITALGSPFMGLAAFADSPYLSGLTHLSLTRSRVGDSARTVVRSAKLGALTHLDFSYCGLTPDNVTALAAEPGLSRIRHLILSGNEVGNDGMVALASSPFLAGLQTLQLRSCKIGGVGAARLIESATLAGIRSVSLTDNLLMPEMRERLRQRLGDRVELFPKRES